MLLWNFSHGFLDLELAAVFHEQSGLDRREALALVLCHNFWQIVRPIDEEPNKHSAIIDGIPEDIDDTECAKFPPAAVESRTWVGKWKHDTSQGKSTILSLTVLLLNSLIGEDFCFLLWGWLLLDHLGPESIGIAKMEHHELVIYMQRGSGQKRETRTMKYLLMLATGSMTYGCSLWTSSSVLSFSKLNIFQW